MDCIGVGAGCGGRGGAAGRGGGLKSRTDGPLGTTADLDGA